MNLTLYINIPPELHNNALGYFSSFGEIVRFVLAGGELNTRCFNDVADLLDKAKEKGG